jgi:hypothetical protein
MALIKQTAMLFKRFVVLHAHECVPETEIKDDICQSDGCPTVAPGYLQQLKRSLINHQSLYYSGSMNKKIPLIF